MCNLNFYRQIFIVLFYASFIHQPHKIKSITAKQTLFQKCRIKEYIVRSSLSVPTMRQFQFLSRNNISHSLVLYKRKSPSTIAPATGRASMPSKLHNHSHALLKVIFCGVLAQAARPSARYVQILIPTWVKVKQTAPF